MKKLTSMQRVIHAQISPNLHLLLYYVGVSVGLSLWWGFQPIGLNLSTMEDTSD